MTTTTRDTNVRDRAKADHQASRTLGGRRFATTSIYVAAYLRDAALERHSEPDIQKIGRDVYLMKYYDFEPGLRAWRRMAIAFAQKQVSRHRVRHQHRFFTDGVGYIDQQIGADGLFERGLIDRMLDVAAKYHKDALYIDIGANIGNHLVAVSPHFERAVGFEPHPALFHVLTANIIINGLTNVELHNFGLGSQDVSATLVESSENHGLSRVKEYSHLTAETFGLPENEFSNEYAIQLKEACGFLSQYRDSLDRALIKIDVEGMEYEILKSIFPLLADHKPVVAFEWFYDEQPEIVELLANLPGYKSYGSFVKKPTNALARLGHNLLFGRRYDLAEITNQHATRFYPLVFLIPD
jgi:FkbM family methyltransferase